MMNHNTDSNVKLTLFDLEFVNAARNRVYVVAVTLLTDVTGDLTELVYDYTKGSNRAKKGFTSVANRAKAGFASVASVTALCSPFLPALIQRQAVLTGHVPRGATGFADPGTRDF